MEIKVYKLLKVWWGGKDFTYHEASYRTDGPYGGAHPTLTILENWKVVGIFPSRWALEVGEEMK